MRLRPDFVTQDGVLLATASWERFIELSDESLSRPIGVHDPVVTKAMVEAVLNVHETSDSLTPTVRSALNRLQSGAPILSVSHEPNTLLSHNIAIQAHTLASYGTSFNPKGHRPVVLFICIDYDVAQDSRFRTAYVPGASGKTSSQLVGAVPRKFQQMMSAAVPPPQPEVPRRWDAAIRTSLERASTVLAEGYFHWRCNSFAVRRDSSQ